MKALWLLMAATALAMAPAMAGEATVPAGAAGPVQVAVTSFRDMPFRTVVRQQYDYSCGSAAVATLLRFHYGVAVDEAAVFQSMFARGDQARIRKVGFSMLDMKNYLDAAGFRTDGFQVSLDEVAGSGLPAITLIDMKGYKHFVVIKGLDEHHVLVGDPAFGLAKWPRQRFAEAWSGIVLMVRDEAHAATGRASFNRPQEWQFRPRAPLGQALDRDALARWSAHLPVPVQVRPVFTIDAPRPIP